MRHLTILYYKTHGRRDLALLATFAALFALTYLWSGGKAPALAAVWVAACAVYAFITSFRDTFSVNSCIPEILLPASQTAKFSFTLLKTTVVFPLLTIIIMYAVQYIVLSLPTGIHSGPQVTRLLTYCPAPAPHLPAVPYIMIWGVSIALVAASVAPRRKVITTIALAALAVISVPLLVSQTDLFTYPFITTQTQIYFHNVRWESVYSWTGLPVKTQLAIKYVWMLMLPAAMVAISYFRYKETQFERWT